MLVTLDSCTMGIHAPVVLLFEELQHPTLRILIGGALMVDYALGMKWHRQLFGAIQVQPPGGTVVESDAVLLAVLTTLPPAASFGSAISAEAGWAYSKACNKLSTPIDNTRAPGSAVAVELLPPAM